MAHYKLILTYDGSSFAGSQRQAKARTVQAELESALRKVGWSGRSIVLAGRTDRGVHASGQVAAFEFDWPHGNERLLDALNANLPSDIAVREVHNAEKSFRTRVDATSRRSRYRIFCEKIRNPLREKMAWRVWPEVNGEVLMGVAETFIGEHDFGAFGSALHPQGRTIRTVSASQWNLEADDWEYEIEADAFLYRMVRRVGYIQVAVAQARCSQGAGRGVLQDTKG